MGELALLPLDERPVNLQLPADVAAIAGSRLRTPPADLLPAWRRPGDRAGLADWLSAVLARGVDSAVLCLDLLAHGGLIASRIDEDPVAAALSRLERLRELHQRHPRAQLHGIGVIQRAPDSYVSVEEPQYWSNFGRELHALGGRLHRGFATQEIPELTTLTSAPAHVVSDFERRRLRNHVVNLQALTLLEEGVLTSLALTADDTAGWSAGSAEQQWLRHWMRALPRGRQVHMHPGADEVGATVVARLLGRRHEVAPRIQVRSARPDALHRIPPYENQPLRDSLDGQLRMAGASAVQERPDAILVVHGPDGGGDDLNEAPPAGGDGAAAAETGELIESAVRAGTPVALADVRYPNGGDPELGKWLAERGLLMRLDAYSAWNTAGNTLGSALALEAAAIVGRRTGHLDEQARRVALVRRLLDDYQYQSLIRARMRRHIGSSATTAERAEDVEALTPAVTTAMQTALRQWGVDDIVLAGVTFPWHRTFEVEIELTGSASAPPHPSHPQTSSLAD